MILGIGTDLIEHVRLQRELALSPWSDADGIYTAQEIASCRSSPIPIAQYAACFAAKEATLKALDLEVRDLATFREVELTVASEGAPMLLLHGRVRTKSEQLGVRRINMSIAAARKLTGALVVLES